MQGPARCTVVDTQIWRTPLLSSLVLAIIAQSIWSAFMFALGYGTHRYRNRVKVSLATHIEQSWTARRIRMSITNHGKAPVVVHSWMVHVPLEDLLPEVAKKLDKPEPLRHRRCAVRRFVDRCIGRLLRKWNRVARANALRTALADSMLGEVNGQFPLLDPGARETIGPGESIVRGFPRSTEGSADPPEVLGIKNQRLMLIPSCRIVGHRRPIWGLPHFLVGGDGSIPMTLGFTQPDIDDRG